MYTNYSSYLTNISSKLDTSLKKIDRGGFDTNTSTLINKLKSDNIQHEANINITGLNAVIDKYKLYQTTFTSISNELEQYKNKTLCEAPLH